MKTLKIQNQSHFLNLHLHRKSTFYVSMAFMTKACPDKSTALPHFSLGAGESPNIDKTHGTL